MRSLLSNFIARARAWRPRFRLRTALILFVIAALAAGWAGDRELLRKAQQVEGITFEIYTDPAAFEERLGGNIALQHIDFDDILTAGNSVAGFDTKRYESRGIIIDGGSGQYASQSFGLPADFLDASQKNFYAPGPVGQNPGANRTNVTFATAGGPGLVCGFGLTFFDVDFRHQGTSSVTLFGRNGRWLITYDAFQGQHHAPVFRGIVAVDATGTPVPIIASARLINGSGWPGVDVLECVALDDFVFDAPQPFRK